MRLCELAEQYRNSGSVCRERARALRRMLAETPMSESDRLLLRRRCVILEDMAREAGYTARYLENYYRRCKTCGR